MIDLIIGAALEAAHDDWRLEQPSRSVYASVIREAARIPDRLRPWASCVLARESGGTLDRPYSGAGARNPSPNSSAQGRWQFLDNSWRHGLAYMVAGRLKDHGMPRDDARQLRIWLHDTPIAEWPAPYQDVGFVAVVLSGGQHHWNGPGCGRP